ncbi:MAG TPA: hypothetical protein VND66_15065 [Acidobacteriaceae bacterium]|nr:hypothetical protein [Acidobacteriaceae bacterium]
MPTRVLYEIPIATLPVRLIMGCVCLVFIWGIFVWWLPKVFRYVRGDTGKPNVGVTVIFLIPIAIGFAPLILLIPLITNPVTTITQSGVSKESAFFGKPVSWQWSDIDHVDCHGSSRHHSRLVSLTLFSSGGQRIDIGNAGGVDIYSVRELLQNQLGPAAMHNCSNIRRQ